MPLALCHPSAPRGTKHSISLLPRPLRWSEGWVPLSTPSPMGSRLLAPILPESQLPMSCERGAHAGTPHTGEVQLACFSCPGCSHHTQQLSPAWSHGRFHLISSGKSALESSSLCEFRPRGHGDASQGALAPACTGMCTRGCWWHRVVLAHGTPGTAAPNPPQTQTHRCRGQGALTAGHQSHPFTQKPGRVRHHTLAPL